MMQGTIDIYVELWMQKLVYVFGTTNRCVEKVLTIREIGLRLVSEVEPKFTLTSIVTHVHWP